LENSSSNENGSSKFPGEETLLAERIKIVERRLLILHVGRQPANGDCVIGAAASLTAAIAMAI
jgi:hypothetical protein